MTNPIASDKNVRTEFTQASLNDHAEYNMTELIHHLAGKIDDLTSMMESMRKQNARFEAKLLHCERMNANIRSSNAGVYDDDSTIAADLFINFESALEEEGLPVHSCNDLDQLDRRLKESSDYTKKLVKYLIEFSLA